MAKNKLSEVTLVENATDSINIFIEEDGIIKRISFKNIETAILEKIVNGNDEESQKPSDGNDEESQKPSGGLAFAPNDDGVSYSVSRIGNCTDTDVVIPSTYKGKPVTSIGDAAFYECTGLTSVTIPDSVTSIGSYAFEGCDSLQYTEYANGRYLGNKDNPHLVLCSVIDKSVTSFTILDSTKIVSYHAFRDCDSLTSITIPNNIISISYSAFSSCSALTNVTIGKGVKELGSTIFEYCSALEEITYEGTVAEWQALDKATGSGGIIDRYDVPVHCTDGDTTASYGSNE